MPLTVPLFNGSGGLERRAWGHWSRIRAFRREYLPPGESRKGNQMHEMSIAQSLIEIIKDEMVKHDAKVLRSVRLNIGQMSAIVPDSLSFCFQVITEGTELAGAEIRMDVIPLTGFCRECKKDFEIIDYEFSCSHCGSTEIEATGGQDLSIVEMEVD